MEITIMDTTRRFIGEGPIYRPEDNCLYGVDGERKTVFRLDGNGRLTEFAIEQPVRSLVFTREGNALLIHESGFSLWDCGNTVRPLPFQSEKIPLHFNDSAAGPDGLLYLGTIDEATHRGGLLRLERDGALTRLCDGCSMPNGMDWSPDGRHLYMADTRLKLLHRFSLQRGELHQLPPLDISYLPGGPDGASMDAEGVLWIAMWGGSILARIHPDSGQQEPPVELPFPDPASCGFYGANYDRLAVTTTTMDHPNHPLAGQTLSFNPGVRGKVGYLLKGYGK